jgi:hypothetical protein
VTNRRPDGRFLPGNGQEHGPGWGGPAKGAGQHPARPFGPGNPTRNRTGRTDPARKAHREAREAARTDREQKLQDVLFRLAIEADNPAVQVDASVAWLNRHEGLPVARTVNLNVDDDLRAMTDAELAAEVAALNEIIRSL